MTTKVLAAVLIALGSVNSAGQVHSSAETLPGPRNVVVLRDITPSFLRYREWANKKIADTISQLGPEDRLLVIDIGPDMKPENNVQVDCVMPAVPFDWRTNPTRLLDWRVRENQLHDTWAAVTRNKESISSYLARVTVAPGGTDISAALFYVAHRLAEHQEGTKYLFIFSDLITEKDGRRSDHSPVPFPSFNGVAVQILFVPWNNHASWMAKESEWKNWFLNLTEARSFHMADPEESRTWPLLGPSDVPDRIPSPLESASN